MSTKELNAKTEAALAHLEVMAQEILVQDNAITADPVFVVYEKQWIYNTGGGDGDYGYWVSEDGETVAEEGDGDDLFEALQALEYHHGTRPFTLAGVKYTKALKRLVKTPVQGAAFFTRKGAEQYIERNKHNLSEPSVFVESAYRNPEWRKIRTFLKLFAMQPDDAKGKEEAPEENPT